MTGAQFEKLVKKSAENIGLTVSAQVGMGNRLWGAKRKIDLVVSDDCGKSLGIECKYQRVAGTAEEKTIATLVDMKAWPIHGIIVYDGEGFSDNMKSYLQSTGKAVSFADLTNWLTLYFLK